ALRIARKDSTELASYDENKFVDDANFNNQPLDNLIEQFKVARLNNILMFDSFDEEALQLTGIAGGNKLSVRAIAYILAGHVFHHTNILKERYLPNL
ncbi:MAG: DinB family protein, partial [Ignavibacteria bacterium]